MFCYFYRMFEYECDLLFAYFVQQPSNKVCLSWYQEIDENMFNTLCIIIFDKCIREFVFPQCESLNVSCVLQFW